MPTSYDNLTFNNGEYIQQYAGVPLKELQNTADVLSTRHYQNLASASQLEILANQMKSKLLPGARPAVDSHITAIDAALQDIAKNGGENATARINALATSLQGNEGLMRAMQRSQEVQKELDLEAEIKAKGGQPLRKQGMREALMNASLDSDLYLNPYQSTVEPYENPVPHMENIWKTINPDSIEGMLRAAGKTRLQDLLPQAYKNGQVDLPLFFEAVTQSGISEGKIGKMLNEAWSSYMLTPAYRQQKEVLGKTDAELKGEFFNHGLLRTFNNISREYRPTPAWAGNDDGSGSGGGGMPTMIPGQAVETAFPYDADGYTKGTALTNPAFVSSGPLAAAAAYQRGKELEKLGDVPMSEVNKREYDPRYIQDYKAMASIKGVSPDIKPDSKEAKELVKEYQALVGQRISNPWTMPFTKDEKLAMNQSVQDNFDKREYMNPATGEIVYAVGKDGKVTEEFIELTGGNVKEWNMASKMDPKNHFTMKPGANEKWVRPMQITFTKDGVSQTFLASEYAGEYANNPLDINTNQVYTKINMLPGQEVELVPGVKGKELRGAQFQQAIKDYGLTQSEIDMITYPIEGTINGVTKLYTSAEDFARELKDNKIFLKVGQ